MKSKLWLIVALFAVAGLAFACGNTSGTGSTSSGSGSGISVPAPGAPCDKVLAKIGSSEICLETFNARLEKIPPFYRKRVATKQGKLEYLNRMVEDELFYLEAVGKGIDKDPEVLSQLDQIKKSILSGKIKKDLMEDPIDVTDDQVKAYYDANNDEFKTPETVSVKHILFRLKHKATDEEVAEKQKLANEVYEKIKSGKMSFEDAAKKYSDDKPSGKKGGELAPIKKGIKSPEFEAAAFGMNKAGQLSDVFKDRRGYNIVQYVKRTEPELKEFDKVEARIKRKLQQDSRKSKMEGFVAKLRENNTVTIHEDLLTDEEVGTDAPPPGLPKIGEGQKNK